MPRASGFSALMVVGCSMAFPHGGANPWDGHPRLIAALQDQAQRFEHVIAANTTHHGMVRLCQRLLAMANGYDEATWGPTAADEKLAGRYGRVFLADNGSTAVEIALKMAIQAQMQWGYGQRRQFACLEGGYHGESIATLAVGDCDLYSAPFRPLMFPSLRLSTLPLRQGPDDPLWLDCGAEWPHIEAQLASQAQQLAAVVYEPVLQGAGGMRLISPDLLTRLEAGPMPTAYCSSPMKSPPVLVAAAPCSPATWPPAMARRIYVASPKVSPAVSVRCRRCC